jgi:hypothetical protein
MKVGNAFVFKFQERISEEDRQLNLLSSHAVLGLLWLFHLVWIYRVRTLCTFHFTFRPMDCVVSVSSQRLRIKDVSQAIFVV